MFGFPNRKVTVQEAPTPPGLTEIIICVFDEKRRLLHHFRSQHEQTPSAGSFPVLNDPERAFESCVFKEAVELRKATSISFSIGEGESKYLYLLPYERKPGKWRFACLQVTTEAPDPDALMPPGPCAMAEDRICLILTNGRDEIISASARVPDAFGYRSESLRGLSLSDLFIAADLGMIISCSPDTNESIMSCLFQCMDGTRREVEVKKYALPDGCMLFGICDVTRPQFSDELIQISTRERRRIGQDLHDSIGQLLTGISLLSRSLANSLQRDGSSSDSDAAQISELADDASNQIRQISRGLMPSEVVKRGLFASLNDLARITTESCGLKCTVQLDELVEFADGAVETHLFRIAQEAVNNAVRHANASHIDILVSEYNGMPQLEIRDNGTWKGLGKNTDGIGMKTMQYRASVICGQLNVGPTGQGGTSVICTLEVDELMETRA